MKIPLNLAVLFFALCVAASGGDKTNFKKLYSAFGEDPKPDIRHKAERLVAVSLQDFALESGNVEQAFDKIRVALQATKYPGGLSLIMKYPDEKNYRTPIKIPKATRNFGETINLLCEQADLVWDFSGMKLTLTPNKAEQAGADQPTTRSESKSEGMEKPKPESEARPR